MTGHSYVHSGITRSFRLIAHHRVGFGVRLIVSIGVQIPARVTFHNSPGRMTVLLCFFAADFMVGLGVKVDDISCQGGVAPHPWTRASMKMETLGIFERHLIPSHMVDEVDKIMDFIGIRLASKRDTQVQPTDARPKTERKIQDSILVVGLGKDVSRSADSPPSNHDGQQPRTWIVHRCGAEVGDNGRPFDLTTPTGLYRSPPRENGNASISAVSQSDVLDFCVLIPYKESRTGSSALLIAYEVLQENVSGPPRKIPKHGA